MFDFRVFIWTILFLKISDTKYSISSAYYYGCFRSTYAYEVFSDGLTYAQASYGGMALSVTSYVGGYWLTPSNIYNSISGCADWYCDRNNFTYTAFIDR